MKKLHIMHVVYSLNIGGLENGVVNLINHMDWNKFSHSICCMRQSGQYAEKLERKDIPIFEMNKTDGKQILFPFRLAYLFKGKKIDIVHTRNWGTIDGVIGARLARVPVVIHGEHGRDITDTEGKNRKRWVIRKGLSYFVDRYVTVSEDLKDWLIRSIGISDGKVQTIWNGVDTVKFNPDGKEAIRAKYGYCKEDFVIGTVGRLDPVKDQQLLIRAFALLTKKYPHMLLLITGGGTSLPDLERLTNNLGLQKNVIFLGMRHDVSQLLKLLDIFVLPSLAEGISNTILESMATGTPVVASHVGGNPELVLDGETGYLFPRQNIHALVKVLIRYIENPTLIKAHGIAGRKRAVIDFGLRKMVTQYETLYTDLVAKKKENHVRYLRHLRF